MACRRVTEKGALARVARRTDGGLGFDRDGRGAYVCRSEACVRDAIKRKAFAGPLRVAPSSVDWQELERALLEKLTKSNV